MRLDRCARIIRRVAERTGLRVSAVDAGEVVRIGGAVPSETDRAVVEEIARFAARGRPVESALRVEPSSGRREPLPDDEEDDAGRGPFDRLQQLLGSDVRDELRSATDAEEPEGGAPYFPATDPVVETRAAGDLALVGGFAGTSMDDLAVARSTSDRQPGDEALAEAVRRELREDAATTDLAIDVRVVDGDVYLGGTVAGPEDAENAEEVAARVPGVLSVVERLETGTS
jgi:hypothetical protein